MKTAPAAILAFLATRPTAMYRADLFTITLRDGSTYRWTSADLDIKVGANTWLANGAVLSRGNLRQTSRLEVDTLDVILGGTLKIGGTPLALLAANGLFDEARLQIDHLIGAYPGDVSMGPIMAWYEGRVAGVDPDPLQVRLSVRTELETLSTVMLPKFLFVPACLHAVYDPNCGLDRADFTLAGAASGSPTTLLVPTATPALTAKAAGYFNLGVLAFTTGVNAGRRRAVRAWDGTTFTLALPLPAAPIAGDTFTVYPGCARTKIDCDEKFDNLINFRGFVHIPSTEGAI
jgi:uncharacterized phage protein (TIGR02218 family)